jgi:hypothetical protein
VGDRQLPRSDDFGGKIELFILGEAADRQLGGRGEHEVLVLGEWVIDS